MRSAECGKKGRSRACVLKSDILREALTRRNEVAETSAFPNWKVGNEENAIRDEPAFAKFEI